MVPGKKASDEFGSMELRTILNGFNSKHTEESDNFHRKILK